MGQFSFERLRWWRKRFDGIDGYRLLYSELGEEIRKNVKSIPDGRQTKGNEPFGMILPIVDTAWGIKVVNGVTKGALITFLQRFILYDFSAHAACSYAYDQIIDVFRQDLEMRFALDNNELLIVEMSGQADKLDPEMSAYIEQIAGFFEESRTAQSHYDYMENMRALEFDTPSAQRYAREGRIEEWVHRYLTTGGWANPEFSEGLKKDKRWWYGPVEVPLASLSPAVGTAPGMEYQVGEEYWQGVTGRMALTLTDPLSLPPLIVEYRNGELSIRDGNTRHGAMLLQGWSKCWVIFWYNSESDYHHHLSMFAGGDLSREVTMPDRQPHRQEVQGFLQKHFATHDWKFTLPHGSGNETYFAYGDEHAYFVKLGVQITRYQAMASLGLTPPVLADGHLEDGTSIIVQPHIAGRTPSRTDYRIHLDQFAAAIHRTHHSPEVKQALPEAASDLYRLAGLESLTRLQRKWQRYRAQVPEVADFIDESLADLIRQIQRFQGAGLVASHNDICNANWLISSDGQLYLIDLESMSLDDPALDIGATLWWYYPPTLRPRFLKIVGYANDGPFQDRMRVRMAMHCLDIALPREQSFDQFTPDSFAGWLTDFRAAYEGRENPEGYD